jgi:hypothetical protein
MQRRQLMYRKPAYRDGQLLLADDFVTEQQFHAHARYHHSRHLHGFGVVHGLEVSRAGEMAVSVSPGVAVDRGGHEIELRQTEMLELNHLPAGSKAWVTIGFQSERTEIGGEPSNRIDCYALLRAATGVPEKDVRLAAVELNEKGHLAHDPQRSERDVLVTRLAPGSVLPESLAPQLLRGWMVMPFHPRDIPEDDEQWRPPFRAGATQAEAHRKYEGVVNSKGAGGTMGIVLPVGIRHLHRFRIAGASNDDSMTVLLLKGGFDLRSKKHVRDIVLNLTIPTGVYVETAEIPQNYRDQGDHYRTLAVDIRSTGYAAISLIALEVSY